MTELSNFRCDICGTVYADADQCKLCESYHKKLTQIKYLRYLPVVKSDNPYPEYIYLEAEDGRTAVYQMSDVIQEKAEEPQAEEQEQPKASGKRKKKEVNVQ